MSQPDYGPLDRVLHRLALGPQLVRLASFDMQSLALQNSILPEVKGPVFIAGLARSGSTILLNALHGTGQLRSLTYRDMPFVLMPDLWQKLSRSSRIERKTRERAHGDRLMVSYDSPEAFEEVFWRTFCADRYIFPDRVTPHNPTREACEKFHQFVRFVLSSADEGSQTRYLAKNNNNLLRLPALKRIFPDAHILVPFRAPLQQAVSLLRQHTHFCGVHAEDRFSMQYMAWLGHWEFGLAHKNYAFSKEQNPFSPTDINYWLQCWLDSYAFALANAPEDAVFLSYESLCTQPGPVLDALYSRLQLAADHAGPSAGYKAARSRAIDGCEVALLEACERVYARLQDQQLTA